MSVRPLVFSILAIAASLGVPGAFAEAVATNVPATSAVRIGGGAEGELTQDPLVTRGQLPNGLQYALRPQAVPPGRVSFFLFVDVGSRHETDAELGYAHFVEHLAFAGSRDFPGDGTIRSLQRFGLGFGSEVNAATGRTYTVYEIRNVPAGDPAAVGTALKVLRNYADGLLFEPGAVERERGVILSEGNVRAGRIAYWWGRELEYLPPFLDEVTDRETDAVFHGTPVARSQIGTPRSLRRATPERLRAFYDRWYRPERMTLAVAGEMDPQALIGRIWAEFGPVTPRGEEPTPPVPKLEPRLPGRDRVVAAPDPQSPVQIVTLAAAVPRLVGDTAERRRRELAEALAVAMLERRLSRTSKVVAEVESLIGHEVPGWSVPLIRMRMAPEDWAEAGAALVTEVRRAEQLGFTETEFAEAVATRRNKAQWTERDAANQPSAEIALALAHATGLGLVLPSASEERRWTERALAGITPEDCRAAVAALWPEARTQLVLTGPVAEDASGLERVKAASKAARAGKFEEYRPEVVVAAQLPDNFGVPGTVASEEHNAALDCWLVQFGNGVQLNFKATPFEHGRVRVRVGFGHGLLGTEPGREGLVFSVATLCYGGLGGLTFDQERTVVNNAAVTTNFGFGADRFGLSATGPAGGLDTVLRLFAARLTVPAFRLSGEAHARAFIEEQLTRYDRRSAGVAEDQLREYLFGHHHALTRPRRADTEQLTFETLRQWMEPQLHDSPVEITVVGDIGLAEVKALVARTFGALPLRATVDPMADRRVFTPGAAPQLLEARFQGKRSVGTVALAWRLPDVVGQEDDCRMRLLASVLEDRIRVRLRQEMGKTYTPVVGLLSERALAPAMLFLRCRIETAPKEIARVSEAAKLVVADLVRSGLTAEELERARLPLVRQAEDNTTNNLWWVTALGDAQSKPQFAVGQGEQRQILNAVTREELDTLAHLLFAPGRLVEVRAVPE